MFGANDVCYHATMNVRTWVDSTFLVEMALLTLAAPLFYFPSRFPSWALYAGGILLILSWFWRRAKLGIWYRRTPADWPIFFLFAVMLPISLWAAPEPLRMQYSIPRALILAWNFCLFWAIVTHASRRRNTLVLCIAGFIGLGFLLALVAPLGTAWLHKLPAVGDVIERIPAPLVGVFAGADSGFHPNQVAGTLLYVAPLALAMAVAALMQRRPWWISVPLWVAALTMTGVLVLTQSRGGLLGLSVGVVVMLLAPWRWGRWMLVLTAAVLLLALPWLPLDTLLALVADAPAAELVGGAGSLGFRQEVWSAALFGLHDFVFTGMGLGTFRDVVFLLYPINIAPTYDLGHAHNFWLQTGLDFGLPGLIALLAMMICAFAGLRLAWKAAEGLEDKALVIGLLGSLVAQSVYSLLDAVAMGAKTNVFFWILLALFLL